LCIITFYKAGKAFDHKGKPSLLYNDRLITRNRFMNTIRTFPLSCLLVGCLLITSGCAYNRARPKPSPEAQSRPVQTGQPTPAKPTATMPTPKPAPVTHAVAKPTPKPTPTPKPMEPEPEPLEPAPPAVRKEPKTAEMPPVEAIPVALNKLPINVHGKWIVDRNESRCMLKSIPVRMDDGQGGTRVTLLLTPDRLQFNTDSVIDLSYTGTGISVDDGQSYPLETVTNDTNLQFVNQRKALLNSMQSGQSMQLTIGFWPTWPVTHTYAVSIPLTYFASAMQAWERCNQLLKTK
jgi:hypothetical protein